MIFQKISVFVDCCSVDFRKYLNRILFPKFVSFALMGFVLNLCQFLGFLITWSRF